MPYPSSPVLVAIDWGTSSLRAHLLDRRGDVLETRSRPWGIQHLPDGGYPAALRGIAGDWLERYPRPAAIAAGMVGSRHGWREVPYVDCPADAATIAARLAVCDTGLGPLHLVPGLHQPGDLHDVMRGEETQILGALAVDPSLASDSRLVLPGTHSKWVTIRAGRIVGFRSFITGELFAVLRDHSILGRPARETAEEDAAGGTSAFRRGLEVARDSGAAGVSGRLFTARSLFLTGSLAPRAALDYLSGLLIGEELRSGLASGETDCASGRVPRVAIIGAEALCDRYRDAFTVFGLDHVQSCGDTSAAGLWQVATAAGLVSNADDPVPRPADPAVHPPTPGSDARG